MNRGRSSWRRLAKTNPNPLVGQALLRGNSVSILLLESNVCAFVLMAHALDDERMDKCIGYHSDRDWATATNATNSKSRCRFEVGHSLLVELESP